MRFRTQTAAYPRDSSARGGGKASKPQHAVHHAVLADLAHDLATVAASPANLSTTLDETGGLQEQPHADDEEE